MSALKLHEFYPLVGVEPKNFLHDFGKHSPLHGAAHVNRVIALAGLICHELNVNPNIARAVWAAAWLHDLARTHEWACHLHGGGALPLLDDDDVRRMLKVQGVRGDHREAIVVAVALHCTSIDEVQDTTANTVLQILKDADALDRVRLGDLDKSMLRFGASDRLIPVAQALYVATGDSPEDVTLARVLHELSVVSERNEVAQ